MRFRAPGEPRARAPIEVRDPVAATRTLAFTSPGLAQVSEWDAAQAVRWAYYANVFVYRCVEVLGVDIASLPVRVGVDPDRKDDWNPDAPLAKLLAPPPSGPAPGISARRLWRWSVAQRAVIGKLGWEIERGKDDRPIAFWPLPGSMLEAIPSTSGTAYFSAFRYGRIGEQRTLRPRDIFYSWRPGMNNWRQPESVLQAARLDVSIAVMQDRYDYAFLKHDARPAAIVVHQAFNEVEARDEWREKFLSTHQGPDAAGAVAFMEVDAPDGASAGDFLDVKPLGLSQRDARFIEREQSKIRAITVAFGVPLSRLGDASNRTFSNAGEEMGMYWGSTIPGWTTELADDVNTDLVPEMGDDLVMWFDLSGRSEARTRVFAAPNPVDLELAGIVSQDEIRHDLGLPPKPDGKGGFRSGETPAPLVPPAPVPPPAAAAPIEEHRQLDHDERRYRLWRASDRRVTALQRLWARQWRTMFRRQRDATLRRLEGKRGRAAAYRAVDPTDVFDRDFWEAETVDFTAGLYEAVFAVGGARVSDLFGLAFDMDAPYVDRWIKARANQLAGPVTDTTYEAIKAELAAGAKAGEDVKALAARIRSVFDEADRVRSVRIARTECLPGDTLVSGAHVVAAYRRWYEGEMVAIETAAGRKITATPNHPMLTLRGWQGMGEISEGDELICDDGLQLPSATRDENVGHPPPTIAEVFDATQAIAISERMRTGQPDFHGDGRECEVDVARPDGLLCFGFFAPLTKPLIKQVFAPSDGARAPVCETCGRLLSINEQPCLCWIPDLHTALDEALFYQMPRDTERSSDGNGSLTGQIAGYDRLSIYGLATRVRAAAGIERVAGFAKGTEGDSGTSEPAKYSGFADTETTCDYQGRITGHVALDKVIRVRRDKFRGHVFNLSTPYGYFAINGSYTGNTISAYNGSGLEVARELGEDVVGGQEWIAARDDKTRPEHADADGQVVRIGEKFNVGGDDLEYPGDPAGDPANVVNCRCSTAFLTPSEMQGRSVSKPRARTNGHRSLSLGEAQRRLVLVSLGKMQPEEVAS